MSNEVRDEIKNVEAYRPPGNTFIAKPYCNKTEDDGIYIPEVAQTDNMFIIVETSENFDADPEITVGSTVLVAGKGGDRIDIGNGTYWIFPPEMVIAVVEE